MRKLKFWDDEMENTFTYQDTLDKEPPEGEIVGFKLKNGLTLVVMKDHSTPVVAVDVWYKVGSRNEQPGKSGFAHLFEHMMFEGSENVGKAQHIKLINDIGGTVNGSTTQDRTNYFEVVPANQLKLALWLEADRMRSLNLSEENFNNQRDTVKEERRMRIDNQPYMRILYEMKEEISYTNFAYKHSVIGSMEDLDQATLDDVRNFHETYYKPNNAILSVVGDIEARDVLKLTRQYFEDIPDGPPIPEVDITEPKHAAERRTTYEDPFAPFPAYLMSYVVPERTHPDFYAIELLEKILFDGESSRFYRNLVEEKQLALHAFGGGDGKFGPGLFFNFSQVHPGRKLRDLEAEIEKEFRKITEEPVTRPELEKAKNKIKAEFVSKQERVQTKADLLCMYAMVFGNPDLLLNETERYLSLTPDDLLNVAKRYFDKNNRAVIEVYPKNNTA